MSDTRIAREIIAAGALTIRDINNGEEPFLYASGNWGPGYVSIKGLVSHPRLFRRLVAELDAKLDEQRVYFSFVAGNATGGMIPGWILATLRGIPYVYVRQTRKKGGQGELVTGAEGLPGQGYGIVVEELVNFAQTTCNSATALRELGHTITHAATILYYDNPHANKLLHDHDLHIVYLLTLEDLLKAADRSSEYRSDVLYDYRDFLRDPLAWQQRRELEPIEEGGTL